MKLVGTCSTWNSHWTMAMTAEGGTAIQAAMISQEEKKPTCLLMPTVL